ncbi:uncharacterized protein [Dermacentor andersoni]|uniref:uncharacterized protein isoform X2 n=1 Tax=Dermacentor andersoni TaxID=34620 RepID=UPI002417640B|nr:uncharacterized protein LOC126548113 isoform X2 [Dermacentor andersoni]
MGAFASKVIICLENLERKVVLLRRFDSSLKGYTKSLEALQDAMGQQIDELHQFVQLQSADLQSLEVDLSQGSSSIESSKMEQTVIGDYDSAMEYIEDFLEHEKSTLLGAHPFKLKPDLAVGAAEQTTSMSPSQLKTASHEMPDTMKPDMAFGDAEQTILMSVSSQLEYSDEMHGTVKPDLPVGDTEQTALEACMAKLEIAGDIFYSHLQEQWAHICDLCDGFVVAIPENCLKTSIKYWMELVMALISQRSIKEEDKHMRNARLSVVWPKKDCRSHKMLLSLRDNLRQQIKIQMPSLHRQQRLQEQLQQDVDFLDMVAIELATSNMDVIDKMHEKHIHDKKSTATELQALMPEVEYLSASLQERNTAARACLVPAEMAAAAEEPPACIDILGKHQTAILQEVLMFLDNIQVEEDDADLEKLASKVATTEEAVNTAKKCIMESDPVSAVKEVIDSLQALRRQGEVFLLSKAKVEGRTFKEWLPDIVKRFESGRQARQCLNLKVSTSVS